MHLNNILLGANAWIDSEIAVLFGGYSTALFALNGFVFLNAISAVLMIQYCDPISGAQ